jgi:hypothetical protein
MSSRSIMNMFAVGCLALAGAGVAAADSGATTNTGGGGFVCQNKAALQVVACVGSISVLPITVNVKDVRALNDNELTILSDDLNKVSILDGGILDNNKILNDAEASVLTDFLDKFDIDVTKNDIDVCTAVAGVSLCK